MRINPFNLLISVDYRNNAIIVRVPKVALSTLVQYFSCPYLATYRCFLPTQLTKCYQQPNIIA